MTVPHDPTSMTPAERVQALAELLGKAYLRLLVSRKESQNPLAEDDEHEAPCVGVVDAEENADRRTA